MFSAPEPLTQSQKDRKDQLGDYEVVRHEYQHVHLFTLVVKEALNRRPQGRQRTKGKDFNVGGFSWSPDGRAIAFGATTNPDLVNGSTSDIYVLTLSDDRIRKSPQQVVTLTA